MYVQDVQQGVKAYITGFILASEPVHTVTFSRVIITGAAWGSRGALNHTTSYNTTGLVETATKYHMVCRCVCVTAQQLKDLNISQQCIRRDGAPTPWIPRIDMV